MTTLSNMLWSENRLYSASQNTAFLSALMAYQTLIESDNKASLFIHTVNDHAFVTFTYSGPVKDGCPAIFMPFQRIPYMRYLVPPARRTVLEMAKGVADVLESEKLCHDMRTTTLPDLRGLPSGRASSTGCSSLPC